MARIDKIKEQIGYLKVVFGIFIAIDISVLGYLFKNFEILSVFKVLIVVLFALMVTFGIIVINKKILENIDLLEDL